MREGCPPLVVEGPPTSIHGHMGMAKKNELDCWRSLSMPWMAGQYQHPQHTLVSRTTMRWHSFLQIGCNQFVEGMLVWKRPWWKEGEVDLYLHTFVMWALDWGWIEQTLNSRRSPLETEVSLSLWWKEDLSTSRARSQVFAEWSPLHVGILNKLAMWRLVSICGGALIGPHLKIQANNAQITSPASSKKNLHIFH